MTFSVRRGIQIDVKGLPGNLYVEWRRKARDALVFEDREKRPSRPGEAILQAIWYHQRIRRERLQTTDGKPLTVIHPGFWNHEAGPDFREAILQFGTDSPRVADVEVEVAAANWRHHGHAGNPAFKGVALQVVWDGGAPAADFKTLELAPHLDAPLEEIEEWHGSEDSTRLPEWIPGKCSAPLANLNGRTTLEILGQAALCRLRRKAAALKARAQSAGWERALWEGLFAALGYKRNSWPMRRLAELLPQVSDGKGGVRLLQSRLLGLAGLLPSELTRNKHSVDGYLRRVWDLWWRERDQFSELILPRQAWRFDGIRPANHPQRRLALAAHWIHRGDLVQRLERWMTAGFPEKKLAPSLLARLQVEDDAFWSFHWTWRSRPMTRPQPLLGPQRLTDLAVNIILPWFWSRAQSGGNDSMRKQVESRYFAWPRGENNARIRMARDRLFGGSKSPPLRAAALQQGLLQIERDFCAHSNAACENCLFPELVERAEAG